MNRRYSIQKRAVPDALGRLPHPTAQEILDEIQTQHPRVSKGTVSRNLALLEETGVVERLFFPGSPDRFDMETRPHNHARGARCGRIFNLEPDGMADIHRQIEQKTGFVIEKHSITLQGTCSDCQRGTRK